MDLHRKALYNLLKYNYYENPSSFEDVETWQIEDLSVLSVEALFSRLQALGYSISQQQFIEVASSCDNPEELASFWVKSDKEKDYDQLFLIIFEIWKKLLFEKQTLCMFCDDLDHLIYLYDTDKLESDEGLQDKLALLLQLLDEHVESGLQPQEVFAYFLSYCANDIEMFLFDYISQQLEVENETYAKELFEGFFSFMKKKAWFDFLYAKILSFSDRVAANKEIELLIEKEIPVDLGLEILAFLAKTGDRLLFFSLVKKIIKKLKSEEAFCNVLQSIADFYHRFDQKEMERKILQILENRSQDTTKTIDQDIEKVLAFVK